MISIVNLTKKYNSKTILNYSSYEFESNGIYVLKGSNGVGKSTFINMIAGISKYNSGKIVYEDSSFFKKVGFVLNKPLYESKLNLKDNFEFYGALKNISIKETKESCKNLSIFFEISEEERLENFSEGMLKKAEISLSLMNNPEYIVWDEPFANLDLESIHKIENKIFPKIKWGLISHHTEQINYDNYKIIEMRKSENNIIITS